MTIGVHLNSMVFSPSFDHYNTIMTIQIGCIYKLGLDLESAGTATLSVQWGSQVKHHILSGLFLPT